MEWLLKIVEGPMNGAEIALVNGMRVSFGRDANCDIVIADAALADRAFELDVTEESVSLIVAGGEPRSLVPFDIQTFGTTAFALGPSEGAWEELRRPAPPVAEKAEPEPKAEEAAPAEESPAPPSAAEAFGAEPEAAAAPRPEAEPDTRADAAVSRPQRSSRIVWWLLGLLLLLLVLAGVLAWIYWPKVVEKCPQAETVRVTVVEKARAWYGAARSWWGNKREPEPVPAVEPKQTLADIAREHRLDLKLQPQPRLSGNLKRRTERLAIRALALAADPMVKLDLTDDETLRSAAEALLFTVTEGAVKATAAADRKVTLAGRVASRNDLETVLRALAADVPGLAGVDAAQVTVGGVAKRSAPGGEAAEEDSAPAADVARAKLAPARPALPVAGILTVPYPCVVMQNGARCTEGALVGKAKLMKIEASRLTFEEEGRTFEWRP